MDGRRVRARRRTVSSSSTALLNVQAIISNPTRSSEREAFRDEVEISGRHSLYLALSTGEHWLSHCLPSMATNVARREAAKYGEGMVWIWLRVGSGPAHRGRAALGSVRVFPIVALGKIA